MSESDTQHEPRDGGDVPVDLGPAPRLGGPPPHDVDDDEVVVWRCPYCDYGDDSISDIRDHLSTTRAGSHYGKDGWKLQHPILGYNDAGVAVAAVTSNTEPAGLSVPTDLTKKAQVISAWFAGFPDASQDVDVITELTDATEGYVKRRLRELRNDELPRDEIEAAREPALEREYRQALRQRGADTDVWPPTAETPAGETDSDKPLAAQSDTSQDTPASATTTSTPTGTASSAQSAAESTPEAASAAAMTADDPDQTATTTTNPESAAMTQAQLTDSESDSDANADASTTAAADAAADTQATATDAANGGMAYDWDPDADVEEPDFSAYDKNQLIVTAFRIAPGAPDPLLNDVTGASRSYIRRVRGYLRDGEYTADDVTRLTVDELYEWFVAAIPTEHHAPGAPLDAADLITYIKRASDEEETDESVVPMVTGPDGTEMSAKGKLVNIMALDTEVDYKDAADVVGCSDEHARRIYRQVERREITADEVRDLLQLDAQQTLFMALRANGLIEASVTAETAITAADPERAIEVLWPDAGDEKPRLPAEIRDDGTISAKELIVNAWLVSNDVVDATGTDDAAISYHDVADVVECSPEHARSTMADLRDGAEDAAAYEQAELKAAIREVFEARDLIPEAAQEAAKPAQDVADEAAGTATAETGSATTETAESADTTTGVDATASASAETAETDADAVSDSVADAAADTDTAVASESESEPAAAADAGAGAEADADAAAAVDADGEAADEAVTAVGEVAAADEQVGSDVVREGGPAVESGQVVVDVERLDEVRELVAVLQTEAEKARESQVLGGESQYYVAKRALTMLNDVVPGADGSDADDAPSVERRGDVGTDSNATAD